MNYSWAWNVPSSVVNMSSKTPLEKTNFPVEVVHVLNPKAKEVQRDKTLHLISLQNKTLFTEAKFMFFF